MNDEDFEKLVEEALLNVPKHFLDLLENVSVVTQNWPNRHQAEQIYKRGSRGLLLGLYEGIPKIKRRGYGIGGQLPDKITIFKMPVLMVARGPDEIERVVKDTVIHEIAHHFGLSDEEIHKAKRKY